MTVSSDEVLAFWRAAGPEKWFGKSDAFDQQLRERFEAAHHSAARGELSSWEKDPQSALALLLLLDQIPRNLYRGSAHSYATDGLALAVALRAIDSGFDRQGADLRVFFYLPLEHAEDLALQDRCVALTGELANGEFTRYAVLHRDIVARFGRFPHRNMSLGRASTKEELTFLSEGGFAG